MVSNDNIKKIDGIDLTIDLEEKKTLIVEEELSFFNLKEEKKNESSNVNQKEKEGKKFLSKRSKNDSFRVNIEKNVLEVKRVVKVNKGGRRFRFTSLLLFRNEDKNSVAYVRSGGKEVGLSMKKALNKAQKKAINYFPINLRTIPRGIKVKYKASIIFMKPSPPGSGIKAGGILNTFFKYLKIKDVTAKIYGSHCKDTVIRAAFIAMDKITGKKYDH